MFRLLDHHKTICDKSQLYKPNKIFQESYNTPLEHTPGNPPYPTVKGFPLQPVGKGLGVCSKGVLKQP